MVPDSNIKLHLVIALTLFWLVLDLVACNNLVAVTPVRQLEDQNAAISGPADIEPTSPTGGIMQRDVWMSTIAEDINDKRINEIVIPGSHNSGSYNITGESKRIANYFVNLGRLMNGLVDKILARWSRTQHYSIEEQLQSGIRYIDLRPYLDPDDNITYLAHGLVGAPLLDELAVISRFVYRHPGEIVIMDINNIYRCEVDTMDNILEHFEAFFGDRLCPPSLNDQELPTYAEMVASNKTVILAITEYNNCCVYSEISVRHPWVWSSELHIISPWPNTPDPVFLKSFLEDDLMKSTRPNNTMHGSQSVLSPHISAAFVGIFLPPHSLKEMAETISPDLPFWFKELASLGLNVIITDFVTLELIDDLIKLNVS